MVKCMLNKIFFFKKKNFIKMNNNDNNDDNDDNNDNE